MLETVAGRHRERKNFVRPQSLALDDSQAENRAEDEQQAAEEQSRGAVARIRRAFAFVSHFQRIRPPIRGCGPATSRSVVRRSPSTGRGLYGPVLSSARSRR